HVNSRFGEGRNRGRSATPLSACPRGIRFSQHIPFGVERLQTPVRGFVLFRERARPFAVRIGGRIREPRGEIYKLLLDAQGLALHALQAPSLRRRAPWTGRSTRAGGRGPAREGAASDGFLPRAPLEVATSKQGGPAAAHLEDARGDALQQPAIVGGEQDSPG